MDDLRRPLVASAEMMPMGGAASQRILMSAIADLKEFTGTDKDEDRARRWFSKVKSALLRDQSPDLEKCLVLEICSPDQPGIGTTNSAEAPVTRGGIC